VFHPIRAYDNYLNANMNLGMLQGAGINCYIKDEYTITIDPLLSPALGGMKLMVDEADVQRALELLNEAEQAYVQSIPCPVCKEQRLVFVTETTHHNSWTSRLRSMLLNGQEQEVKIFYRCDNCKAEFRELPA
jgi:hypothetical protein